MDFTFAFSGRPKKNFVCVGVTEREGGGEGWRDEHLITYKSVNNRSQINFFLLRNHDRIACKDFDKPHNI